MHVICEFETAAEMRFLLNWPPKGADHPAGDWTAATNVEGHSMVMEFCRIPPPLPLTAPGRARGSVPATGPGDEDAPEGRSPLSPVLVNPGLAPAVAVRRPATSPDAPPALVERV